MDYFLTEEQTMIRDLCRQIAEEKIRPQSAELDEKEEFPWEIIKVLGQSDMFRIFIEEKYGGTGGGVFEFSIATEELSRACAGVAIGYAGTALGAYPIMMFGSEEQKKKYLPDIASGKRLAAFALTESAAGSDAAAIQVSAKKEGEHYIINGTKQWITNGGEAEIYVVFAVTNRSRGARGISAFIVEKGTKGFDFGKKEKKLGIRASATRELVFTDCKIPEENLLNREGMGFPIVMATLDKSRPGIAAQAVGIAQGALDLTVEYAKKREQFGNPITAFQGIQFMLADMATQIEAARALTYAVCREIDRGAKKISKDSAMAKLFASDMAMKVTIDCVQIFGGYGYMKDYPIEKYMRDAKITQIYEGTNQIQRSIIAAKLIKENAGKNKAG